ncbi:malate dehydrogenase [Peptoclostridium acidaminophilum DSM 3953]|uniref:Malate dehydrogenase n=1 Tax=Peptoclostridium acidaminophilum DSM 3953 TaxID=1286171 RepID=W8T5C6_PEPAC|nr:Ldh family oxidoreductase [Peptoclostridium acidaminophilum]AHM56060.1 malate dehydrogenase [Peptoclostridium acidaminophilum DSM 3953]
MIYHVLYYEELKHFCQEAFEGFGLSENDSAVIKDVLLLSDLYGIDSHGTNCIVMYHDLIKDGNIDIGAQPEIVMETPVSAVIDGKRGMEQLMACYAAETAIEKAKTSGIGFVTVRNSNHYGIAVGILKEML